MIGSLGNRVRRQLDRVFRPGPRGLVLLYHRVADEPSDPYGLCVPPAHFEEHLQVLKAYGYPMSLSELFQRWKRGDLPNRAVGVTFDDGYADNLHAATPLLERHGIPATVFVTTGAEGREREFWWDELERVFLEPARLPDSLQIEVRGAMHSFGLTPDENPSSKHSEGLRKWRLLDEPPTRRHSALQSIYGMIQPLAVSERAALMDHLVDWAGIDSRSPRPTHRAMTPPEVREMAEGVVWELGAHTVTHPVLPAQEAAARRAEIQGSKEDLEEWIGDEIPGFAYPYGFFDRSCAEAVRQAGFSFACSTLWEPVGPSSDAFLLPRVEGPQGDGDSLGRLLREQLT